MTQDELEAALDTGKLQIRRAKGRWYKITRSGLTKQSLVKGEFRIPCKVLNNKYLDITQWDMNKNPCDLRIVS